jgi:tetratricopeptide repeat protein 8
MNFSRIAQRPALAMCIAQYILFYLADPKKGLELAAEATKQCDFQDWWWKEYLAKCYRRLGPAQISLTPARKITAHFAVAGLLRDAEKQAASALKNQSMVSTALLLANIYLRLDVPNTAISVLSDAM